MFYNYQLTLEAEVIEKVVYYLHSYVDYFKVLINAYVTEKTSHCDASLHTYREYFCNSVTFI